MSKSKENLDEKAKREQTLAECKKIEMVLRENQKKHQDLIETTYDFVWEMDCQGRYTYCSPQMEKLWGLKPAEMIGKSPFDMMTPSEKKRVLDLFMGMANSPKPLSGLQTTSYDSQGRLILLEINEVPFFDDQGRLLGFRGISRDVTERNKAEQSVIESEAKYRELVNLLPEMVFEIDSNAKVVFANERALELTKYSKEDFKVGFDANYLVALEDRERSKENMKKMFAGDMRQSNEYTFVRKDGTRFLVSLSSAPVIKDGKVTGARGVAMDITERKEAEDALRVKEERYSNLANSLPEIVFETDIKGKLVFANTCGFEITGYTKEDLAQGIDIFSLIAPQDKKKATEHFMKTLNNQPSSENEFTVAKKDGGTFPAIVVTSLIVENEHPIGLRGLVVDITERKKLEKQVQDQERLAAIGATAGMVGHDIRNPLQAIIGDLYLAREDLKQIPTGKKSQMMKESLDAIEENILYIDKIISDLQDYTRPLIPDAKETNLKELIDNTLLKVNIPKNIRVEANIGANMLLKVDAAYLRRVFTNLIVNAVQAMSNGGKLIIEADTKADKAVISIKDTGVGITEKVKPNLFTPLFTTKSKGQGLGLAVVKRLVEAQGGTVRFESKEGKGTTFIIELNL